MIDRDRLRGLLEEINTFGALPSGGIERLAWSEAEVAARRWLLERCRGLGLEAFFDQAGNVWAFSGRKPAVVMGSHLDSVPDAGRFDGALGIAAALEALAVAVESNAEGADRLGLVCFTDEEGVRFGLGMSGSRAVAGQLDRAEVEEAVALDGTRLVRVMTAAGFDPTLAERAADHRKHLACYLELHVEQGRRLERAGRGIAIVTGIVAVSHWRIEVRGEANHAGTTLPADRKDALIPIAVGALEAQRMMREEENLRATVGECEVVGGAPNIVPGLARCSLDVRSPDEETMSRASERIVATIEAAAVETGCAVKVTRTKLLPATPMAPEVRAALMTEAQRVGEETSELHSMAGHDAMSLAAAGVPCGMVLVRSQGGVSHSPREHSSMEDCSLGAEVMLHGALRLARE